MTTIMKMSQLANIVGLGLERRLAVWNLSYLMLLLSSVSFLSCFFLTLTHSLGPSLPNLCDVALLLLKVDFGQLLKVGLKAWSWC